LFKFNCDYFHEIEFRSKNAEDCQYFFVIKYFLKGIRVEIIGQIELFNDRGNTHDFLFLVRHLTGPETLTNSRNYEFEFPSVEKPYESYTGTNVRLRYYIKATVMRGIATPNISKSTKFKKFFFWNFINFFLGISLKNLILAKELEFCVHMLSAYPNVTNPLKMEVGFFIFLFQRKYFPNLYF